MAWDGPDCEWRSMLIEESSMDRRRLDTQWSPGRSPARAFVKRLRSYYPVPSPVLRHALQSSSSSQITSPR